MAREVEPGEVHPTSEWVGPPSKFKVGGRSEKGPSPNSRSPVLVVPPFFV